jgi:arylsulfatase A-like enzyme
MEKNVIIILIDAGRLDYALSSSVFNKLKPKSSFFSQAITYAPHTIAAMHAVFSGCFGNRTGTNSYWSTYKFKKSRFKTLTEYLHENGYHTECDLLNKLIVPRQGFDEFQIHDELNDNLVTRHSELVKKMVDVSKEKKFFLYLHYSKIHTTIMNEVLKVYTNQSKEYFEKKEENKKRYSRLFQDAEIYLDSILQVITQCGFDKNSLILVMSDHGISVGEKFGERAYGAFCYDYTIKTFAYYMSSDFEPKEIREQVRHVDFMPTILDQLNIELDGSFEPLNGVSLIPLINGKQVDEKIAYTETANPLDADAPPKKPNTKSVRTSKWKFILNEYNNSRELYDLENDPDELENIAGNGLEIEEILFNELNKLQEI